MADPMKIRAQIKGDVVEIMKLLVKGVNFCEAIKHSLQLVLFTQQWFQC